MIYLLVGDDVNGIEKQIKTLKGEYLDPTWESINYHEFSNLDEVESVVRQVPLGSGSIVVVVKNYKIKADTKVPPVPTNNLLIISTPSLDSRLKVTKELKKLATVKEYKLPNYWETAKIESIIKSAVKAKGLQIDAKGINLLVKRVGVDTSRLDSELDKLALLGNKIPTKQLSELVLNTQSNAFDLAELIINRSQHSLKLLDHCLSLQHPMEITGGLIYKFRELFLAIASPKTFPGSPGKLRYVKREAEAIGATKLALVYKELFNCQQRMKTGVDQRLELIQTVSNCLDIMGKTYEPLSTKYREPTVIPTSEKCETKSKVVGLGLDTKNYIYITDNQTLDEWLERYELSHTIGIDTETTGLDPHTCRVRLLQMYAEGQPALIVDFDKIEYSDRLKELMTNNSIKIAHNWAFDWKFLHHAGYTPDNLFDTLLAEEVLKAGLNTPKGYYTLKGLAQRYLKLEMDKTEQKSDWSKELTDQQLQYAALDVQILPRLYHILIELLEERELLEVVDIENKAVSAVAEMEYNGMKLDLKKWGVLVEELERNKAIVEEQVHEVLEPDTGGQLALFEKFDKVNLNSPQDLVKALRKYGIEVNSTGVEVLTPLVGQYPILKPLLEYKTIEKRLTAFGYKLPKEVNPQTGRIHPRYNQNGAASGRFSCASPNLQQIPRTNNFRECFVAEEGWSYVIADYSQIELRIGAEIANDKKMIEAYQQGKDLHKLTASLVLDKSVDDVTKGERQLAKATNFGLIYGQSAEGYKAYSETAYGVKITIEEATSFRERYFDNYSGMTKWHNKIKSDCWRDKANSRPTFTRTLCNRRRIFSDPEKTYLNPLANTPVQGTGADITKIALGNLRKALNLEGLVEVKIIGTVHDEIILEAPNDKAELTAKILVKTMEDAGSLVLKKVPVIAESGIGSSWAEK